MNNILLLADQNSESKRYLIHKLNETFIIRDKNVIFIQKHVRRYLFSIQFAKIYANSLQDRMIIYFITIQNVFRKYSLTKKYKTIFLMKSIRAKIITSKDKIYSTIRCTL